MALLWLVAFGVAVLIDGVARVRAVRCSGELASKVVAQRVLWRRRWFELYEFYGSVAVDAAKSAADADAASAKTAANAKRGDDDDDNDNDGDVEAPSERADESATAKLIGDKNTTSSSSNNNGDDDDDDDDDDDEISDEASVCLVCLSAGRSVAGRLATRRTSKPKQNTHANGQCCRVGTCRCALTAPASW